MYWLNKIVAKIKLHFSTNQNKTSLMEKAKDYEKELQKINPSIHSLILCRLAGTCFMTWFHEAGLHNNRKLEQKSTEMECSCFLFSSITHVESSTSAKHHTIQQ